MRNDSSVPATAEIRRALEAFNDEKLSALCLEYFPPVHDSFTPDMSKGRKIRLLLQYCEQNQVFPNLLAAIGNIKPEPRQEPLPSRQLFICYAYEDTDFAHRLARDLAKNGWPVWIAPESIAPGDKWVEAINLGLDTSTVFILVLTSFAIQSHWVKDETNVAIGFAHKQKLRLIPLEVEPCDVLPPLWQVYQRVSFCDRYEDGLNELLAELDREALTLPQAPPRQDTSKRKSLSGYLRRAIRGARQALADPAWQGIGVFVGVLACAIGLLTVPQVQALLWPLATSQPVPTLSVTFTPPTAVHATATLTIIPSVTWTPAPSPSGTPTQTAVPISPTVTPTPTKLTDTPRPVTTVARPAPAPVGGDESPAVTLLYPINAAIFKDSVITFRWAGGALQPGESFVVELDPDTATKKGICTGDHGNAGMQYSGLLTAHEWTTDIAKPPGGKAPPCPGRVYWTVYVKDAAGNVLRAPLQIYFEYKPGGI